MGCTTAAPTDPSYESVNQSEVVNETKKNHKDIQIDNELNDKKMKTSSFSDHSNGRFYRISSRSKLSISKTEKEEKEEKQQSDTEYKYEIIDYKIFAQNTTECTSCDDCIQLLRIINLSKYYHNTINSINGKQKFIEFCTNQYKLCIDDYIHFITVHCVDDDDLMKITKDLEDIKCNDLNQCQYTERHYNDNHKYNIYIQLFDTIHFNVFHLEELGLKIKFKSINNDENKYDDNYDDYLKCIDQEIAFIQNEIQRKTTQYPLNYNRLNKNKNKRYIMEQTQFDIKQTDITFIEEMIDYIYDSNKKKQTDAVSVAAELKQDILNDLRMYIVSEQYDTDSIMSDIDIFDNNNNIKCNLLLHALNNNIQCIQSIQEFIKYKNISSNAFFIETTGFQFFYHKFYQNTNTQQDVINNEQNEIDLFVSAHFNSMKEEILNSSFIDIKQYEEDIIFKGNRFIETNKCKEMKCIHGKDGVDVDPLHFNISYGAILQKSHLYALILYCDYIDFYNVFLSTFKRIKWNESIQCIKQRNSKYHHISKRLIELIKYYGITGDWQQDIYEYEYGPFYVGIASCINIDTFLIPFNAPTSTSKQKEIIMRFCSKNGIVIQLNNQQFPSQHEVFFDSSWISAFPEENERIFCASKHKMKVETIIVMETRNNYKNIMSAYYKFDAILSGKPMSGKQITEKDAFIINKSIEYVLDNYLWNDYIMNNFYLFTIKKTQIILDLDGLYEIYSNDNSNPIIEFLMYSIKRIDYLEIQENNDNLLKPMILKLFRNLTEIIILSSHSFNVYAFNMLSLLTILNNNLLPNSLKRIIIKDEYPMCSIEWLKNIFSEEIKQEFETKNLKIELQRKKGKKLNEDWITITV